MLKAIVEAIVALLIAAAGGALFYALGVPLPWTLGSLTAAAFVSVSGGPWLVPGPLREFARPVVGILAGSAFTPAVVASIGEWWGAIVFVAVYSFVISVLGWLFFRRICRLDAVTSFFASTPGGLGELTLLGGQLGGNMRILALVHAVRIVAVVFAVPLLLQAILGGTLGRAVLPSDIGGAAELRDWLILAACGLVGYALAKYLHLPGGIMVAAMLCSAAVHATALTAVVPPGWMVALVQIVIGAVAGSRFAGLRWQELRTTVLQAVAWSVVLLATAAGAAVLGAYLFARPFAALVLAVAPGGIAEMTIISYALGIETAFVITCQVCRSFVVLTFAPLFYRLFGSPGAGPPTPPTSGKTT